MRYRLCLTVAETIHDWSALAHWAFSPSLVVDSLDSLSHLGCFHLQWMTKALVWMARPWSPLMPIGIMNDEVEKLPLSEGHNTALNRKAFRKAAGRRWWCWGLSDTPLIRGSSSEVVVCTMKHADGDTMTHMLRLTGAWFRRGTKRKKQTNPGPHNREFHDVTPAAQTFLASLPVRVSTYWFDLRENALSLLIAELDRLKTDMERKRGVSSVVAREWKRDMQKGRAVSLRNELDKRKGLGRWAEETSSTLLN